MSTAVLRQEFEDHIRRDLLGPAGGEQEAITEQSVRNRYLLGMLAPLKVVEVDEEPFDELADGSEDNAEEGTAEPSTPAKRGVAPSTFGLSFCLDLAETAFEAAAHWGQYLREPDADGKTVWKRYPRGSNQTIPLKEGNLRAWSPDAENPQVVVRGRVRRRAGHWSVTLFLSNEQEEGRPRDMYWLFQAELAVRGRFARRPGQGHVSTLDKDSRLEDQANEMLFRRDVEFARGHGTSVAWDPAEDRLDQAVRIRTAVMPRAIVRTVTMTSFGIFQVPRLVEELERSPERGVALRIVLGDREPHSDQEIDRQRHQLGNVVAERATLLQWPSDRRARDEQGHAGLMHVKAAVADSRVAFLTSANLTEAALERNMELGVLIRGGHLPAAIDRLIDALVECGELQTL